MRKTQAIRVSESANGGIDVDVIMSRRGAKDGAEAGKVAGASVAGPIGCVVGGIIGGLGAGQHPQREKDRAHAQSTIPFSASQRSASIAAMHPVPAAVTA